MSSLLFVLSVLSVLSALSALSVLLSVLSALPVSNCLCAACRWPVSGSQSAGLCRRIQAA
ncbi:hypothetical protein ACFYO0_01080 [Streptomyces sp. NPDC006365]|uniref:hypothetical protein n=1 Tax=Streptomyces sp. NPDC006365 TaxID=3364744 RepID=UPI0036CE373D